MVQQIADKKDIDFVLHEQFPLQNHAKFKEFKKKVVDLIVNEARNFAIKEILPTQAEGGEEGCKFENGEVKVPQCFHRAYKLYQESGWLAMCDSAEYGGQELPKLIGAAVNEYLMGANSSFVLYNGLTHGAAKMIERLGSDEQKEIYLKNLYSGKWSGTMLLTEPDAGSDLGALETKAFRNDDGTFSLVGNKIFISGGEQDLTENIIHPVLARIEGAPAGVRGISMFIAPKFHVNKDGSLGERNDVVCTGIEKKMGLTGSSTCSLSLGSKGKCIGTLLGEENKGLQGMFLMMNESRQLVGLQGLAIATTSYIHALNYARERMQGRHLLAGKDYSAGVVSIIEHPDVRRQLITMKAYVEGLRSLLFYTARCYDEISICENKEEIARLNDIIDVLTPIIKGYGTDKGLEVSSHAVQVFGGYGYIKEYPVEQLMRDSRIAMLYEGTNGIQAMDLLGRKLSMKKGQAFLAFLKEIDKTIENAKSNTNISSISDKFIQGYEKFKKCAAFIQEKSMKSKDEILAAYANAYYFMEAMGDIVVGWMLLDRANIASKQLEAKKDDPFYLGQVQTATFFMDAILPVSMGKMAAVDNLSLAAIDIPNLGFGSK